MLKAKRFHLVDFVFVLMLIGLIASIFILMSSDETQSKQRQLVESGLYKSFVAVLAQAKLNSMLLFELQYDNEIILPILNDANDAIDSPSLLTSIKQKLHRKLHMSFQVSRQTFPHQQVYLVNGASLLHLDKPYETNKFNDSNVALARVLKNQQASFGLSLNNGRYLYRYLFPVFNDRKHFIAVVEVALPLVAVQQALMNVSDVRSQFLLAKRPLASLDNKNKLYEQTPFSESFFISKNHQNDIEERSILNADNLNELKASLSSDEETKLFQLKRFSMHTHIGGRDGVAVFMPIYNLNGYRIGGVMTFSPHMALYLSKANSNTIVVFLLLMFLLTLLYAIRKSTFLYQLQLLHQRFLDAVPFPVFLKDENEQYLSANKAFYTFFNVSKKQLLSKKQGFDSEPDMLRVSINEINDANGHLEYEYEEFKEKIPFTYKLIFYGTEKNARFAQSVVGLVQDVSDKKQLHDSLKESLFDQNQLMNMLPVGLRIFNLEGKMTYVNKMFENLSGYNRELLLKSDCESMFTCLQCNLSLCPLNKATLLKQPHRIETIKYNAQGEAGTYEVLYQPYYSTEQQLQGIVEITSDISDTKSLLDKNHALMLTDELTGLLNHRGIMYEGSNYFRLAQRTQKPFFALYIEIAGMAEICEQYGEKEGDALIKAFSTILQDTFRETDIIARISDDDFVILMNDSDYRVIDNAKFTRLDNCVEQFNDQFEKGVHLVIDTGIVEFHKEKHPDLLTLINAGEQLVYEHRLKRISS